MDETLELIEKELDKVSEENNKPWAPILGYCKKFLSDYKLNFLMEDSKLVFCESSKDMAYKLVRNLYNSDLKIFGNKLNPSVVSSCELIHKVKLLDIVLIVFFTNKFNIYHKEKLYVSPKIYLIHVYRNIYNPMIHEDADKYIGPVLKRLDGLHLTSSREAKHGSFEKFYFSKKEIEGVYVGPTALKYYFDKRKPKNFFMFDGPIEIITDKGEEYAKKFKLTKVHFPILDDLTFCYYYNKDMVLYNSAEYDIIPFINQKNKKIANFYVLARFMLISALINPKEKKKKRYIHDLMLKLKVEKKPVADINLYYGNYVDNKVLISSVCEKVVFNFKPLISFNKQPETQKTINVFDESDSLRLIDL